MPAGTTQEARDPFALGQLLAVGIAVILGVVVNGVFGINRTARPVASNLGLAEVASPKSTPFAQPRQAACQQLQPSVGHGSAHAKELDALTYPLPRLTVARHTIAVAKRLKRNFIGIDIFRTACDVMKERLGGNVGVIGGESEQELRAMPPHEFARLIIVEKLGGTINPKKSGDLGIDGWIEFMTIPVQVKRWEHKVGRREIDRFRTSLQRDRKVKGIIVAFDFSRDCFNEVEIIKREDKVEIQLKSVKELFQTGLE